MNISSLTILGWQLVTGTSLHSSQEMLLQSGRLWVAQDVVLFTFWSRSKTLHCISNAVPTSQVKVLVILTSSTTSGSWYQSSLPSVQLISGTMNLTFFGTNLHSCQVTGSQASLPAHTWEDGIQDNNPSLHSFDLSDLFAVIVCLPKCDAVLFCHILTLRKHFHMGDHLWQHKRTQFYSTSQPDTPPLRDYFHHHHHLTFLPWLQTFSIKSLGASTELVKGWASIPSPHSVYGTTCELSRSRLSSTPLELVAIVTILIVKICTQGCTDNGPRYEHISGGRCPLVRDSGGSDM